MVKQATEAKISFIAFGSLSVIFLAEVIWLLLNYPFKPTILLLVVMWFLSVVVTLMSFKLYKLLKKV